MESDRRFRLWSAISLAPECGGNADSDLRVQMPQHHASFNNRRDWTDHNGEESIILHATPQSFRTFIHDRRSHFSDVCRKVTWGVARQEFDSIAIEEPLEIQLNYGPPNSRQTSTSSVTIP